jgi:hypothetical protein
LSKLTNNNQENNVYDRRSTAYASSISSITSPTDNDQLADSNTNLNISNVSSTNNEFPTPDNTVLLVDDQPSQSTVLSPKQSLVPHKLSSAKQQSQQSTNKEGEKTGYNSSLKASTPVRFLYAVVDVIKVTGAILDIVNHLKPRNVIYHVPFCKNERRLGVTFPTFPTLCYCLKKTRCDFSHDKLMPNNASFRPYLGNYAHPGSILFPNRASVARYINPNPFPPPQNYYQEPRRNLSVLNPLTEIHSVPALLHQPT